jgi:hypothetical protein
MDYSKIHNIVFDGIDYGDHPDYCDAFILDCEIDGVDATDEELEEINENRDFVYEKLIDYLF